DGRLEADLYNEYAHVTRQRIVDQVVVEHGTLPSDELYFSLVPGSTNLGEVDQQALLDLREQQVQRNPDGRYQLFRIGDAVASRNIHAAVFDAYRLCLALCRPSHAVPTTLAPPPIPNPERSSHATAGSGC